MADRLHLKRKHREVLESLQREHLPGVEVWAYGSRVSGKCHDGSDLDLVLRGPGLSEIPIGQLGDFEEAVGSRPSRSGGGTRLGPPAGALSPGDRAASRGAGRKPVDDPSRIQVPCLFEIDPPDLPCFGPREARFACGLHPARHRHGGVASEDARRVPGTQGTFDQQRHASTCNDRYRTNPLV